MSKPPIRAPPVEARPPPKPGQGIKLETIAKEKAGQAIVLFRFTEDPRRVEGAIQVDSQDRPYLQIGKERAYIRPGHRIQFPRGDSSKYYRDVF